MMEYKYKEEGYIKINGFFQKDTINRILEESKLVFAQQMINHGLAESAKIIDDNDLFENMMFELFRKNFEAFSNCGKQVQHLISLHRLSLSEKIEAELRKLGLGFPNISTRPVLFFNHENLAKEKVYHTVFTHQDWRSMQGSLDSVVVWIPLIDITEKQGALRILPKSHKNGLVAQTLERGFGKVELSKSERAQMISVEAEVGDALFFSSLLIHESGVNSSGNIRWSTHFRYNNLEDDSFIKRNYPHAYIYKPITELITKNFPLQEDVDKTFKND
ncbi:MAG: phytanoyl-CoA dioxygenase family protein [bacterium]|nr:phytanoyl-CoA dioxygenase family protein [bacterium]